VVHQRRYEDREPQEASPYVVVPGWRGSGPDHWQTLWESALDGQRVELRDWSDPRPERWIEALDAAIARLARPPVLIAHSLGCLGTRTPNELASSLGAFGRLTGGLELKSSRARS
jgi:hypothetical protein